MDEEVKLLENLITDYDRTYGEGKGHEIMGSLMFSHGLSGIIDVFKKAKGREILIGFIPDICDSVTIRYKKERRGKEVL